MDLLFFLLWNIRPSVEPGLTLFSSSLRLDWTPFMLSWWIYPVNPRNKKKFCFSPPVLFHSNWSFLTQILRVCEPFIFRLSLAYLPSCPCLNQQQVKWFCLQTIPHRCSPLHSHSLKSKAPTFLPWSVVASSALVLPLN